MTAQRVVDRGGATKGVQRSRKEGAGRGQGFTDEERAAMRERAHEVRASRRRGSQAMDADGEIDVLAKISEMPAADRVLAERLHALVKTHAPGLSPRTWYGMPAYAKDGNVVCFFKNASKFKSRYATLGFSDKASLDDGAMWPTEFALTDLNAGTEVRIVELITRAVR